MTFSPRIVREAFAVALAKGLPVQPKPDQVQVFLTVQEEYKRKKGEASAAGATPGQPIARPLPQRTMTGPGSIGDRLRNRQQAGSAQIDSGPRRFKP